MGRIIEATALINAKDGTGAAFASVASKLTALSKTGQQVAQSVGQSTVTLGQKIADLRGKIQQIDNFKGLHQGLVEARSRFNQAQADVVRFARAVEQAGKPSRDLARDYERAQRAVSSASRAFDDQRRAVSAARAEMAQAGIPLRNLGAQQEELRRRVDRTTASMRAQQMAAVAPPKGRAGAGAGAGADPRGVIVRGHGLGSVAPPIATGFVAKSAYDRAIEFEKSINASQARGELSPEQAEAYRRNARDLGARGLGFTSKQVSELQRAYAQAGYEKEATSLALPTLQFSAFGEVDPFKAADYTVSALSAYRIKPKTPKEAMDAATRYQDIVAKGANISRLSVDDFAQGFKFAAPLASALGVSQEQLAAMIATQGQSGLAGNEAGVAVRSMLTRTVKPTADSRQAMAELGMRFEDYQRETKPISADDLLSGLRNQGIDASKLRQKLPGVIEKTVAAGGDVATELSQSIIDGMGITKVIDKNKISKMVARYVSALGESLDVDRLLKDLQERKVTPGQVSRIFDAKQGTRLSTIVLDDMYQQFVEVLRNQSAGASARGAAVVNQGAVGAHNRLVSSYDNLVLSVAESGVLDTVSKGLDAVASGLRSLSEMSPKLLEFGTYAGMAAGALGPLSLAVRGLSLAGGAIGLGGAASAAATALPAAATASRLPFLARAGLYGAAAYAGYQTGEAIKGIGEVAGGKHFIAKDADGLTDLRAQLAEIEARIQGVESRVHPAMRDMPNADLDRMRGQAQDLRNRIDLSSRTMPMPSGGAASGFKVDNNLPDRPQGNAASNSLFNGEALANQTLDPRLTKTAQPTSLFGAGGPASVEAVVKPDQVTAKAEVNVQGQAQVSVQLVPTGALAGLIQAAQAAASAPLQGGSGPGSTGRSMPEAAAPTGGGAAP